MYYARNPEVKLRREHFGGIAFNKINGKILELDREACLFLELADARTSLKELAKKIENDLDTKITNSKIHQITETLLYHNFLVKDIKNSQIHQNRWPKQKSFLSAPESVHLALTHRCNYQCESCYVKPVDKEMTTQQIKSLIDDMAEMKVFQLAIGGGEPFLRDDLAEIVDYADSLEIVPNITTNGSLISSDITKELSGKVGQIQLSVNGYNKSLHELSRPKNSFNQVLKAIKILREEKIRFGFNVLLTKDNFREIEMIAEFGVKHNASTVNFIRPKPSKQDENWYEKSRLSGDEYKVVASNLKKALNRYPKINVTIDCALSFLMNTESKAKLQKRAVYGCAGGKRFLTVHPNGDVYPCSFLDIPDYCGGNVVEDGLKTVWKGGFQKIRNVKEKLTGKCRGCKKKEFCMGCRAVVLFETGKVSAGDSGCFS